MTEFSNQENVTTPVIIETDIKEDKSSSDIEDLSEHIISSLSSTGMTGQMLVDEVFKGFLAKKLEDIESEHQQVHEKKKKKKKKKEHEGSKSRKHKHKKKHRSKSSRRDKDLSFDDSDVGGKKDRHRSHSGSGGELVCNDAEEKVHSKHRGEIIVQDEICKNKYDQQKNLYFDSNNPGNVLDDRNDAGIIKEMMMEEPETDKRTDTLVDSSTLCDNTECQLERFPEGKDGVAANENLKNDYIKHTSDLSFSLHRQLLSNLPEDVQQFEDSGISSNNKKVSNFSECNANQKGKILFEMIESGASLTDLNKKESFILDKSISLDNKVSSFLKEDSVSKQFVTVSNDEANESQGQAQDYKSDLHRSEDCQEIEGQKIPEPPEITDLTLDSPDHVSESNILDPRFKRLGSKSDDPIKQTEECRKSESGHVQSSEKRSDVDKRNRHSHGKHEKRLVACDRTSKDFGSTSRGCKDHSKYSSEKDLSSYRSKITSDRSPERNKQRDFRSRSKERQRPPRSSKSRSQERQKARSTKSRSKERQKVRSARSRSKERQKVQSARSRSTERKHTSRKRSQEKSADKSGYGSRHKSKTRKRRSTREKSVEIIEEEDAESADASDKLTERLLKRLSTSIKKGQELKAEKHSFLESHLSPTNDTEKPVVSPQNEACPITSANTVHSLTESNVCVSVTGTDLCSAITTDCSAVNTDDLVVSTVPIVNNESVKEKNAESSSNVRSTLAKVKKPAMKMGIRLTETSFAIISSGIRFESEPKEISEDEGEKDVKSEPNLIKSVETSALSDGKDALDDNQMMTSSVKTEEEVKGNISCSKSGSNINDKEIQNEKKSKKRRRSRSRSKSRGHPEKKQKRNRSKERRHRSHKSRSKDRSHRSGSRSRDNNRRSKSRSRDKEHRSRSDSRERNSRSKIQSRNRSRRSRSRSKDRGHRSDADRHKRTSRSRSSESKKPVQDLRLKIDKAKLREIAIKNVYGNLQSGARPVDLKPDAVAALKAGGKSVEELTDFCKRIAEKEKNQLSESPSLEDDKESSDEDDKPFTANAFKARDLVSNIVLNIRNSKPLPVLTNQAKIAKAAELRTQFPVSSGSQHRAKEWVPVEKTKPGGGENTDGSSKQEDEKVFPDPPAEQIDVSNIVSERLSALRKLQSDPSDVQALGSVAKSQQKIQQWAASKQLPGLFMGSTGVNVLSHRELMGNNPKNQAWVKKDTFTSARPVESGIGKLLLQRMGWKDGQGLGKNNEGMKTPLLVDIKMDRKGLTSTEENPKRGLPVVSAPIRFDFSGKHPVSALNEICTRRKWNMPDFVLLEERGPAHSKMFRFKVEVNGVEYAPISGSPNKKTAKLEAATVCLQELGLLFKM